MRVISSSEQMDVVGFKNSKESSQMLRQLALAVYSFCINGMSDKNSVILEMFA
jgi:hypothetical protein